MANLPFGDSRVLHLDPTIGIKSNFFYRYGSFLAQMDSNLRRAEIWPWAKIDVG